MCGGGGKGTGGYNPMGGQWGNLTPQQQVTTQASPEAIGWYQQAMGKAQQAAATPWQNYSTNPADFVAQLNQQQQSAQQGLAGQAAATAPFAQMGAGMQAAAGLGNAAQMAGSYMNPFMQQVVSPVQQALQQQQGQQLAGQQAEAIRGGAFGGERAGLQRQALRGQQQLGMGQALSPLYQTGYGQALQAAQTDLARQLQAGQGLSQAGIAAQQASLGAGTLGQQTEQAGKTALYNQFQQARMYPYQQAQFLANIAGGLGPLLGQQSYQSQATNPFGMFLADGGAVDESRMGGAVTDGGDYARGGYAYGGGDDFLSSQGKMYDELNKPVDTSIPTGQIQAARALEPAQFSPLPKQESGLDKASKFAGLAEKGISGLGKVYDFFNPSSSSETGGMGADGEQDSGSSTLGSLAKTGAKLGLSAAANYFLPGSGFLAGMFADGGRAGYEDGGDIFERGVLGAESGRRQFDEQGRTLRSPKGAAGIAQVMPGTAPEAAKLAGVPYNEEKYLRDKEYNAALGKAYFNEQVRKFGDEEKALAAYNAGPGRVRQAIRKAEATGRDYKEFLPRETQEYIPSVYRHAGADDAGVGRALTRMTPAQRSYMASAKGVAPAAEPREESGLLDTLTSEKYVVPALTGLGAALEGMVTSPTVGIGGALLRGAGAGIGAGAKQYGETAKGLEERRKLHEEATTSAAEGKLLGAETLGKLSQLPVFQGPGGMKLIRMADGSFMNLTDWLEKGGNVFGNDAAVAAAEETRNRMLGRETTGYPGGVVPFGTEPSTVTEGNITTPGGVAGPGSEAPLPAEGTTVPVKDLAKPAATQPPILKPAAPVQLTGVTVGNAAQAAANQEMRAASSMGGEGAMAESSKIKERIDTAGAAARPQAIYNAQVANIISEAANAKSWDAPGAASETRANIVNGLNTLARSMGLGDTVFGEMESRDQMLKKINAMRAEATVTGANQSALGSLETVLNALPSQGQAPRAGSFNAASNWVQNQKQIDKQNYANAYGLRSSGLYNMVDNAFDQDNAQNKYAAEEKALQDLMLHPGGPKIIDSFMHGRDLSGSPLKDKKAIDRFFEKNFKVPGMSRYFMGTAGG